MSLFRGACEQRILEDLRLRGNPVADLRYYRTMALIAFGKLGIHGGLRIIDGAAVKKSEIEVAGSLGKVKVFDWCNGQCPRRAHNFLVCLQMISEALREGWILDTVANSNAGFLINHLISSLFRT